MSGLLTLGPKFTRPACHGAAADIARCLLLAPELSSKPADAVAAVNRRARQRVGRTLNRFITLTVYDAKRAIYR